MGLDLPEMGVQGYLKDAGPHLGAAASVPAPGTGATARVPALASER